MTTRGDSGIRRAREARPITPSGDGHADRAPTRQEFDKLIAEMAELDNRVNQNRKDIDVQFQRLAELQAVIDRMQMAAKRARGKDDSV